MGSQRPHLLLSCVQPVPWPRPALNNPPLSKQREAVVVDHSLGWERNVMYAQTVQNFLLDAPRKPRPRDAFQTSQPDSRREETVHSWTAALGGRAPPPGKRCLTYSVVTALELHGR